eukprot:CAMPEP_0201517368 /NCGR_PEP_ID=MMETSP0161_2-20130828/8493_1 /ASSEMBLY_ACC=CAM_ASM_000251 /TAXON_ID=180227 /ORGANISM="Neoparamoeba aestuarina, Strain SoJaBio B1-5/56/2" /LENGTH=193 /DNA_ID=CAMNT_0047914845 /DNA_START=1006 /DNA_END=1587 /DNA_ORIENTATION=+
MLEAAFRDVAPSMRFKISFKNIYLTQPSYTQLSGEFIVRFTKGYVREVLIGYWDFGIKASVRLDYIPNSTRCIRIIVCDQEFELKTRLLPREAQSINLSKNRIFGNIDLRNLPANLEEMDVSDNHISGDVLLDNLPYTLENLDLRNNQFQETVAYYGWLPEATERICLQGNRFTSVHPILEGIQLKESVIRLR